MNVEQHLMSERAEITAGKSSISNQPANQAPLPELNDKTDNFALLGLVSWGFECGFEEFYGIYTEVRPYLNWVLANTHDATYCTPYWSRRSGDDGDKAGPSRPPSSPTTSTTPRPNVPQTGDEPVACGLDTFNGVTYPWQVS